MINSKFLTTIFLSYLTFSDNSLNAQIKAELAVNIKECRKERYHWDLSELKILKNNKNFKLLKLNDKYTDTLKDLDTGNYSIIYKTLFDKEELNTINISESKKYSLTVCVDYLDYSKEKYTPIIDKIIEEEGYKIHMFSQGCVHSNDDTIVISKTKSNYIATLNKKSKILTKEDIEFIRHFEIELNYMKDGGCTTTDTYVIEYKEIKVKIEDGGCDWNGDYFLKKQLFGVK